MTYGLLYSTHMGMFVLENPMDCQRKPLTESELDRSIGDNPALVEWKEYAKANPNTWCMYDMLPA